MTFSHGRRSERSGANQLTINSAHEGGERMADSLTSVGAITLFVGDPQRSKAFYAGVFKVEAVFEDENSVAFKFDNLFLNLLKRGAAVNELLGPVPAAEPGASF